MKKQITSEIKIWFAPFFFAVNFICEQPREFDKHK